MVDWCLGDENIKHLLSIDPALAFEVLYKFFEGEVSKIINGNASEANIDEKQGILKLLNVY